MLDYGSRTLLQVALYPFKKWSGNLHVQALMQSDFIGRVAQLWVCFQNLIDPISKARILMSQLVNETWPNQSFRLG